VQRPPPGTRKVVLATNIAETSITVDDVVYVVDSGRVKQRSHDTKRDITVMRTQFVSAAAAKQRRGRAGRVRPGHCVRLFSRQTNNAMVAQVRFHQSFCLSCALSRWESFVPPGSLSAL